MILAIDTSLGTSVAVVEDDGVVRAALMSENPLGHAEVIGDLIQSALAEASVSADEISTVAAGMGPGPFTGLRVGIAAARAFALAQDAVLVPVVSHDAVALDLLLGEAIVQERAWDAPPAPFAIVTDARRKEYAYTLYSALDDDGLPLRTTEPALVPRDELDARLAELGATRHDVEAISAAMIGLVAARSVAADRVPVMEEPLYLRSPDVTPRTTPKRVGQ